MFFSCKYCVKLVLYLRQWGWPDEPQSQHVKKRSNRPSGFSFSVFKQKLHSVDLTLGFLSDSIVIIWPGVNGGLKPNKLAINTTETSFAVTVASKEEEEVCVEGVGHKRGGALFAWDWTSIDSDLVFIFKINNFSLQFFCLNRITIYQDVGREIIKTNGE